MRVKPHLAKYLLESPLSGDMVLQIDEPDVLVTASVGDTWQLKWWLLSMADDLEVVSPTDLRQSIAERHRLAALKYAANPLVEDPSRQ
jgi:predicted DNA-binding transcriptional regulator YafY